LEQMVNRLADDHARARTLADGLRQTRGIVVDNGSPYSNMVYLNLSDDISINAQQIGEKMKRLGILLDAENARRFRLVTHYQIDDDAIEKTIVGFRETLN